MTFDVGWGYDAGEEVAHITTNASPGPSVNCETDFTWTVDFFRADEVVAIEDVEGGGTVFDLAATSRQLLPN